MEHKLSPIKREHIIKAANNIDRENMPKSFTGDYKVVVNSKQYDFKYITRVAYKLATGIEVKPDFFKSNKNYRKKIEDLGFPIINKNKITNLMSPIKIYKIAESASPNAEKLFSNNTKSFYWNSKMFKHNSKRDKVIFINKLKKLALYTEIDAHKIPATYSSSTDKTSFNHNNESFTVDKEFDSFTQFKILQQVTIPDNWNWTKQIGVAEIYDIWKKDIDEIPDRVKKIDDLLMFFTADIANQELLHYREALVKEQVKRVTNKYFSDKANKELLESKNFYFENAKKLLDELLDFNISSIQESLLSLLEKYKSGGTNFIDFTAQIKDAQEKKFFELIGMFVAHVDHNAANKNVWNTYPDKRVIAKTMVRQNDWVTNLLQHKIDNTFDLPVSIKNVMNYLQEPYNHLTVTSLKHKEYISENLLKMKYETDAKLVSNLKYLFNFNNFKVTNQENTTRIISEILYNAELRVIWDPEFGKDETVKGLVVCDNTGWLDSAITDLKNNNYIVLWWDKRPTGTKKTLKLLKKTIKHEKEFYIYYTIHQIAYYRARILDFSEEKEYPSKNWNHNEDVAWHSDNFRDYNNKNDGVIIKKARIVFLADKVEKLVNPISVTKFKFLPPYQPPTQNLMQPYIEINEIIPDPEPKPDKPIVRKKIDFNSEDRSTLMAIKTKPFILLAGLSGTGKSRLVRKLAYHTCAIKELQKDKPGNFLLIPIRPNWHDSTEILGYTSRIRGEPTYITTPFLHFIVKAWRHPEIPFFLCLDEMNLAPVEQYFAEYLSLVETRKILDNGDIITDAILSEKDFNEKKIYTKLLDNLNLPADDILRLDFESKGITLPSNLVVMGTVNMDETTHSFSRKVLDRAMTFEMNEIDLKSGLEAEDPAWDYPNEYIMLEDIRNEFALGGQIYVRFKETADEVIDFLETINGYLDKTAFKIAYRVRDEFLIYTYHNSLLEKKPEGWLDICLDELTVMKVLSRIEGDETKVRKVLDNLINFLNKEKYPASSAKLEEMKEKLEFGYTSFW